MIGFEEYSLSSWHEDGLISAPRYVRRPTKKTKRGKAATLVVTASLCVLGLSQLFLPVDGAANATSAVSRAAFSYKSQGAKDVAGEVPPGYWTSFMARLQQAPSITEDPGLTDPDPFV